MCVPSWEERQSREGRQGSLVSSIQAVAEERCSAVGSSTVCYPVRTWGAASLWAAKETEAIHFDARTKENPAEVQMLVFTPLYNIPTWTNKQKPCFIFICATLVSMWWNFRLLFSNLASFMWQTPLYCWLWWCFKQIVNILRGWHFKMNKDHIVVEANIIKSKLNVKKNVRNIISKWINFWWIFQWTSFYMLWVYSCPTDCLLEPLCFSWCFHRFVYCPIGNWGFKPKAGPENLLPSINLL